MNLADAIKAAEDGALEGGATKARAFAVNHGGKPDPDRKGKMLVPACTGVTLKIRVGTRDWFRGATFVDDGRAERRIRSWAHDCVREGPTE